MEREERASRMAWKLQRKAQMKALCPDIKKLNQKHEEDSSPIIKTMVPKKIKNKDHGSSQAKPGTKKPKGLSKIVYHRKRISFETTTKVDIGSSRDEDDENAMKNNNSGDEWGDIFDELVDEAQLIGTL
jgi:hypothetical protein